MPKQYQQRTVGAVVKVPLDEEYHTYAQILPEADYAFFDARTRTTLSATEAAAQPVLFRIAVMNRAVTSRRWLKIGKARLKAEFEQPVPKFIQDPIDSSQFRIYLAGAIRPASRSECKGLERCAVWDPEHVEDRLRAYYSGASDKWTESLKVREAV